MKVVIVGGGAAGLIASIFSAKAGAEVTLLEKNEKLGKKIYITGKGRCNITNACDTDAFFDAVMKNPRFMFSSYNFFDNSEMMRLLEDGGLRLKTERGNRVFPSSDKASDVTKTLEKMARSLGVNIELYTKVEGLLLEDVELDESDEALSTSQSDVDSDAKSKWTNSKKQTGPLKICLGVIARKSGRRVDYLADSVIIATGGLSYPTTGSDGDGYKFAESAGLKVEAQSPSLVPIFATFADGRPVTELAGLSLKNVTAKLLRGKKQIASEFGEMLFTHTGVSGPIIITLSSIISGKYEIRDLRLFLDFKPALSAYELDARLLREFDGAKNKTIKNVMRSLLPESMIEPMLRHASVDSVKPIHDITKADRESIIRSLKNFELKMSSLGGFNEAIITRGGVSVKELNPATMESKKVKGLYFAGETIDIDAVTGGFNLQLAWTTGAVAGKSAGEHV